MEQRHAGTLHFQTSWCQVVYGQAGGPGWQGHVGRRVSHSPWALRASVSRFWGVLELSNLKGCWRGRDLLW